MRTTYRVLSVLAILASLSIVPWSASAGSIERSKGESWTYQMTVTEELMGLNVNLSGKVTYGYVGAATETVGEPYSTNVLEIDGNLQGNILALGVKVGTATVALSGHQSELAGTIGILKEELMSISDLTVGSGLISFTYHLQSNLIVTAVPPVLAEFDPGTTQLGASWAQSSTVNTTLETWENGTLANTTTEISVVNYTATVSSALDTLELPAGVFHATKVQVIDDHGNYDIFWWSSDANNIVQHEVHENGSATPVLTLTLTDFSSGSESIPVVYAVAGGAILVIAVVVLVLVIMRVRQSRLPPHTDQDPGHISEHETEQKK